MAFDLDQLRARLRAAHPVPLSFDHLHADAMWRAARLQ